MIKLIVCTLFVLFVVSLHAQDKSASIVTIQNNEMTLSQLFDALSEQTGYRFSYNPSLIDVNKKISLKVDHEDLGAVLGRILPENISYKVIGKHVILVLVIPQEHVETVVTDKKPHTDEKSNQSEPAQKNIFQYQIVDIEYASSNDRTTDTIKVKKISSMDSGSLIFDCLKSESKKNNEEMKKQLTKNLQDDILIIAVNQPDPADLKIKDSKPKEETGRDKKNERKARREEKAEVKEPEKKKPEKVRPEKEYLPVPVSGEEKIFQASFVYPLGNGWIGSITNSYQYSFNMIGGLTGRTNRFEVGGVFNMNTYSSRGVQIANVFNLTGISNKYRENSDNLQIAAVFNYTRSGKSSQLATANIADSSEIQLGVVNISKNADLQAGVVNYTRSGKFQVGIVNVRDTADGFMIGLVNIAKKGGLLEGEISYSELLQASAAFRSGIPALYGILGFGYSSSYDKTHWSYGFGTTIPLRKKLDLNLEAIVSQFNDQPKENNADPEAGNFLYQIMPLINFKISRHYKIFAGPTLNLMKANSEELKDLIPYNMLNNTRFQAWVGYKIGARF